MSSLIKLWLKLKYLNCKVNFKHLTSAMKLDKETLTYDLV